MPAIQNQHASALEVAPFDFAPAETGFGAVWLHRLMASSRTLRQLTLGAMARLELAILSGHKDNRILVAIRSARQGRESLLSGNEAFTLFSMARAQSNLPGSMAELGVYQGCSAKIISMASENVDLHLFDTFEGLPEPGSTEKARLRTGLYAAGLSLVQAFLDDRETSASTQASFRNPRRPAGKPPIRLCTSTSTCTRAPSPAWNTFIHGWFKAASSCPTITPTCMASKVPLKSS
nr:TylF/MycF family methyltransferase [Acidisphaera sp. L21]